MTMQLCYSTVSPYARKCRMVAILAGLQDELTLVLIDPLNDGQFRTTNPLGKVPALLTPELTLVDSPLICEYLNDLGENNGRRSLYVRGTPSYYPVQLAHVRADGILDAAVSIVMENRRQTEPSPFWLARWHAAIETTITEQSLATLGSAEQPIISTLAFAAALAYLDFRLAQLDWRTWNKELAQWYEDVQRQTWFMQTAP